MTTRPQDVTDLYLAPVILELDHRLGGFEGMSHDAIELQIALETDLEPRDPADRSRLMLQCLTHGVETHGWKVAWAPRGLAVLHDDHQLVLGIPDSVRSYLDS